MRTGVALAIAIGAVLVVYYVNRTNETKTALQVNSIMQAKQDALPTAGDAGRVIATGVATYIGGPKAGAATWQATGGRL